METSSIWIRCDDYANFILLGIGIKNGSLFNIYEMMKRLVLEIVSAMLILLFLYTAVSKLLDYQLFQVQLSKSPFITDFAGQVSWALPAGEMAVAVALAYRPTRLLGLFASLFLMTLFTAYIYAMLHYSYHLPCSCGGVLGSLSWKEHLWFNAGFVVLSIIGIVLHSSRSRQVDKMPRFVFSAMQ